MGWTGKDPVRRMREWALLVLEMVVRRSTGRTFQKRAQVQGWGSIVIGVLSYVKSQK